jgi:hypothetical protein
VRSLREIHGFLELLEIWRAGVARAAGKTYTIHVAALTFVELTRRRDVPQFIDLPEEIRLRALAQRLRCRRA